jgi:hypothetical protein
MANGAHHPPFYTSASSSDGEAGQQRRTIALDEVCAFLDRRLVGPLSVLGIHARQAAMGCSVTGQSAERWMKMACAGFKAVKGTKMPSLTDSIWRLAYQRRDGMSWGSHGSKKEESDSCCHRHLLR